MRMDVGRPIEADALDKWLYFERTESDEYHHLLIR